LAEKAGQIEIPPVEVLIDGRTVHSEALALTVLAAGEAASESHPARSPRSPQRQSPGRNQASGAGPSWDDLVFIEAEVDKTEVFEGEAISLVLSLWVIDVSGVRIGTPFGFRPSFPTTEGFLAIPQNPEEVASRPRERNGWRYQVSRWVQALYPTAPGAYTIPSWKWQSVAQAWTDRGFQEKDYHLAADPLTVTVKPLPDRPPNFSGAVGQFKLEASLKRDEVIQGVPTELTLVIQGRGNPNAIGDVPLPKIEGVYMGDPAKESRTNPETMTVQKAFTYPLTPLEPGEVIVPPVEFCFFDPEAGIYQTLRQGPFKINVLPAVSDRVFDDQGLGLGGQKVRVLAEDIMPLVRNPGSLRRTGRSGIVPAAMTVVPVLAYAGLALTMARRRRFASDTGFARAHRAKKKALAQLERVARSDHAADALYHALIGYVADKCDVSQAGMTSADVQRLFGSKGVEAELTENFLRILRRCERSRYASATLTPDEVGALAQGGRAALDRLDALLKNGRQS
jgi:hypothetical protein